MKGTALLSAWLLWQSASLVNIGTAAAPEHLRWQRAIVLPGAASGVACAELDAQVLAHTASAAHNDLRVYRGHPGSRAEAEIAYQLTESGPEPVGDADAQVVDLRRGGDGLLFDLRMPGRAYSEVDLRLRLKNYVGTAVVSAEDSRGRRLELGNFGLFDLSNQGLGAWTALALEEGSAPLLHVALTLRTPEGRAIRDAPLAVVEGAAVPPSRLRQTIFVPVAAAAATAQGSSTISVLQVPAHVPVERIRFDLPGSFAANYARDVTVRARTDGDPAADTEVMNAGDIQHVQWASGDPRLNPIDVREDSVDATTGATLAGPATIRVTVLNGQQSALPIRRVTLEMRERKLCFATVPGGQYTLRYGDPALAAPVYDSPLSSGAGTPPVTATLAAALGPEQRNPAWQPRRDQRPYLDRHPEVFWVVVLICGGLMGATGLHIIEQRGQGGQV